MALYAYQALAKDGRKVSGHLDAASVAAVRDILIGMSLFPVSITAVQEGSARSFNWKSLFAARVSTKEKVLFTKQLAVLLKSGVPLLQAMDLLTEQFEGQLKSILISLRDGMKEGQSLASGLQRYPKVFNTIYIQLVRAGEASGRLEVILERLTEFLEQQESMRKRVKDALMYPVFQLVSVVVVVTFLLVKVIPDMAATFEGKAELPYQTRFLLNLSHFVRDYYILIIGVLGGVYALYRAWASTPSGAYRLDALKLKLPIIGFFTRMTAVVQFSRTLSMLLEGGVNLPEALDIVCNIVDNRVLVSTLREARDKIIKQGKMTQFLKQTDLFPSIAIYLIKTGEESGKLDHMLAVVAQTYEAELMERADGLSAALGPVMMFVMAGVVGFVVMAIALPMMQMNEIATM